MSRRRWHVAVLAVALVTVSCSAGELPESGESVESPATDPDGDQPSAAAEVPHYEAACATGRPVDPDEVEQDRDAHIVVGPVTYLGARTAAQARPPASGDITFFKMGAVLPPHTVATVTVVETTAPGAAISVETGPEAGARSVTYDNCEDHALVWVGGLVLHGQDSGCVTLEMVSDDRTMSEPVQIPLNASECD